MSRYSSDADQDGRVEPDSGEARDGRAVEQQTTGLISDQRDQRKDGDEPEAYAKGRVAKQLSAACDQPSDHWRMVVIAERREARPKPVVGFVGDKAGVTSDPEMPGSTGGDDQNCAVPGGRSHPITGPK